MSSLLLPRSGDIPRIPKKVTNLVARKTVLDWEDINAQIDALPDELPDPVGYTIMILQIRPKAKTEGGIELPDDYLTRLQSAMDMGVVLALGDDAYKDKARCPSGIPWCQPYDVVGWVPYAGSARQIGNVNVILLNDDQIKIRFPRPAPRAVAGNRDQVTDDDPRSSSTGTAG